MIWLFLSAFGAASLLPGTSEPLLISMLIQEQHSITALWLVASLGNTLGSVLNWWLGRYALHWQYRRWFPVNAKRLAQASIWFQRFGIWSLLLAWLPLIGDAITLVAGILRTPLAPFIVLVAIGKSARYGFLIYTTIVLVG